MGKKFNATSYSLNETSTVQTAYTSSSTGSITYKSDDTSIATVDSNGKITGVLGGTTKVHLIQAETSVYKSTDVTTTVTVNHSTTYDSDGLCSTCHTDGFVQPATTDSQGRYVISNIGKLCWFRNQVNSGSNTINGILTVNIDFTNFSKLCNWKSIAGFAGVLDGDGHTIKNFNQGRGEQNQMAMFQSVASGGVVKNFTFDSALAFEQSPNAAVVAKENNGTISHILITNSSVQSGNFVDKALLVGKNTGTVEYCGVNKSAVTCRYSGVNANNTAGLVGENTGTIRNSYTADISFNNNQASQQYALCRNNGGTITNCYVTQNLNLPSNVTVKTVALFNSGEVTFLLNNSTTSSDNAWHQTIGTDNYPVIDATHGLVYKVAANCIATEFVYRNDQNFSELGHPGYNANGLCTNCGDYEPLSTTQTIDNKTFYEIKNAGQLCSFRKKVNEGNTSYNAILTKDIDLSSVCGGDKGSWSAIGVSNNDYSGIFDGAGHAITNLSGSSAGLFEYTNGATIRNLSLSGSIGNNTYTGGIVNIGKNTTFDHIITNVLMTGRSSVKGGIVAQGENVTLTYCANLGNIEGYGSIGGLIGDGNGSVVMTSCYGTGKLTTYNSNCGSIIGSYYDTKVTSTNVYALEGTGNMYYCETKTLEQFKSGEVCFLLNGSTTNSNNAWHQTLGTDDYPTLDATHGLVYKGVAYCTGEYGYRNDQNFPAVTHDYDENGICSVCSGFEPLGEPDGSGYYHINNVGQFCTFRDRVNAGELELDGYLEADIDLSIVYDGVEKTWIPIGTSTNPYKGKFTGHYHKITGLIISGEREY